MKSIKLLLSSNNIYTIELYIYTSFQFRGTCLPHFILCSSNHVIFSKSPFSYFLFFNFSRIESLNSMHCDCHIQEQTMIVGFLFLFLFFIFFLLLYYFSDVIKFVLVIFAFAFF